MANYTKTFLETRRFKATATGNSYEEVADPAVVGLDTQVQQWVDATKHLIVQPGQPSIHQSWMPDSGNPHAVKVVTIALTVLYIPASEAQHAIERANASARPGTLVIPTGSVSVATPKRSL
jgi:hypothetical protein